MILQVMLSRVMSPPLAGGSMMVWQIMATFIVMRTYFPACQPPPHGKKNKITTCHDLITLQTEDVLLVLPKYSESAKRLSHPHIASQQILCLTWKQRVSKTCVSPEYSESAKFVSHPNIASQQNTCITWIQQVSKTCVSPEYSKSAKRVLFIRI